MTELLFNYFRSIRHQEPHSENTIVIKSPKPPLVLGSPPRLAYPLVVFLIRETEGDEVSHPDDTVSSSLVNWFRMTKRFDALESKSSSGHELKKRLTSIIVTLASLIFNCLYEFSQCFSCVDFGEWLQAQYLRVDCWAKLHERLKRHESRKHWCCQIDSVNSSCQRKMLWGETSFLATASQFTSSSEILSFAVKVSRESRPSGQRKSAQVSSLSHPVYVRAGLVAV